MSCSKACDGGAKMRMVNSCNGCRALRKGCSDGCTIRPCLEWISTPEAQANATVFLAKFYGRAGLLNLIAATPDDDHAARPAVFRSLIYEACGRLVNPVYGAVGLLWSGQWKKCVDAVDAMFRGEFGVPVDVAEQADVAVQDADAASEEDAAPPPPPPKQIAPRLGPSAVVYDIRHFDKKDPDVAAAADLLRVARAAGRRGRKKGWWFKRAGSSSSSSSSANLLKGKGKAKLLIKGKSSNNVRASSPSPPPPSGKQQQEAEELEPVPMAMELLEHDGGREEEDEIAGSHDHHLKMKESKENTDVEAVASHVIQAAEAEPPVGTLVLAADQEAAEEEVGLELTLG